MHDSRAHRSAADDGSVLDVVRLGVDALGGPLLGALAEEGTPITAIDDAMKAWGMPMGPFELMDEIGLDVTRMILESLSNSLGDRFLPPPVLGKALEHGWLGKKSGRGFYSYD